MSQKNGGSGVRGQRLIKPDLPAITKQWTDIRPPGGFPVFLADPPWFFENHSQQGEGKNPVGHYPCMRMEDIHSLPVSILAAENAVMGMWVTWPLMPHWLPTLAAWGFEYAGLAWEWIKFNPETGRYAFGPGYATRKNLEPCLLATRGNPRMKPGEVSFFGTTIKTGSHSVRDFIEWNPLDCIRAARREHSRKPEEAAVRLEAMFDGPYIELFARSERPGWTSWGNETDKFAAPE